MIATSGPVSLYDVADEVKLNRFGMNMGALEARLLAQRPTGPFSFADFRGRKCFVKDFVVGVSPSGSRWGFSTTDAYDENFLEWGQVPSQGLFVDNAKLNSIVEVTGQTEVHVEMATFLPRDFFYAIQGANGKYWLTANATYFEHVGFSTIWRWTTGGPPRISLDMIPGQFLKARFYK